MTNKQAFPAIDMVCSDRTRRFCLNLGGFRALEEYMRVENDNPDFDILKDFNWEDESITTQALVVWAGLFTDARKHDSEPWTLEKCDEVVSVLSFGEVNECIKEALARVLSPAQMKKLESDAQKKTTASRKKTPRKKIPRRKVVKKRK